MKEGKYVDYKEENMRSINGPRLWKKEGLIGMIQKTLRTAPPWQVFAVVMGGISIFALVPAILFSPKEPEIIEQSPVVVIANSPPTFVNVPPGYAYVNESFEFTLRVVDSDNEYGEVTLLLKEKPDWMKLDGKKLMGTPSVAATPSKIIVILTDGVNEVEKVFYIAVVEREAATTETVEEGS